MLNGISLFSGYAGIDLALKEYVRPVIYCDIEKYAQGILLSRMDDESIPFAPIWNDVTTMDGRKFKGLVDIIYGGFPCQDISVAGKGAGLDGERSGLFGEIIRIAKEASSTFIFLENVPAIRTRGSIQVQEALASIGYDSRWCTLSAAEIGANHKRERWFCLAIKRELLANSESIGSSGELRDIPGKNEKAPRPEMQYKDEAFKPCNASSKSGVLANTMCEGLEGAEFRLPEGKRLTRNGEYVAHSMCEGLEGQRESERVQEKQLTTDSGSNSINTEISNTNMQRQCGETDASEKENYKGVWEDNGRSKTSPFNSSWWSSESSICRVVDGSAIRLDKIEYVGDRLRRKESHEEITEEDIAKMFRADRIKACGNGVVPLQAKVAFETLIGIRND